MLRICLLVSAAAAALVFNACGPEASEKQKPRVIATTSILADWVRNIGSEDIELHVLAGPGSDPHTYQTTPADAAAVETADLVISVGSGYESWLPGLLASTSSKAKLLELTRGMPLIDLEDGEDGEEDEEEDGHGENSHAHQHEDGDDPHFWHDPELAMQAASEIANALKPLLPGKTFNLDQRSTAYQEELRQARDRTAALAQKLPAERRKLVTSHDSFAYFARRFGFKVLGNTLGSLSTESSRPSAADLTALVAAIKASGVPAIFPESTLNPGLVAQIAKESGVKVAPPLMAEALNPEGQPGATYLEMIEYNAKTICTVLGGED